jgi:hypothetical protein
LQAFGALASWLLCSRAERIMNGHAEHHVVLLAVALASVPGVASAQQTAQITAPAVVAHGGTAYQATRMLVARSTRLNKFGWLEVHTTFRPGEGLTYAVLREGGDQGIRNRVLRKVLENEIEMSAPRRAQQMAISDANYAIARDADSRTLRLMPRRKEPTLINGTAEIDARGQLLKVEGRLAKSPSFWVRSVSVRRTYQAVGGYALPVLVESVADVKFAGACEFSMWIDYTMVGGLRLDRTATRPGPPNAQPSPLLVALQQQRLR